MPTKTKTAKTTRAEQKALLKLSPFELKDKLMELASESEKEGQGPMLNAGRGNPNWLCTTPREAFGTLLHFAIEETRRGVGLVPDVGRMPEKPGSAQRFTAFLDANNAAPGAKLLRESFEYGVRSLKFDPDTFAHELTDGIIGDMYPVPGRMLRCTERIVHEYLVQEMCAGNAPSGKFDIFAVEGGTAAMCYIFDSLMVNGLLRRGDTIALAVPTFQPYIEIPHLDRYKFKVVSIDAGKELNADGTHSWQYADSEIDKLGDKRIKAFFLVNPSNPPSLAMRASSMQRLVNVVKKRHPGLMIVTDDVYGTFVPGFRSLMAELPHNTIGVYSYSKHFGCTGWRLGVIAVHQDNMYDQMLQKQPAKEKAPLIRRYHSITMEPEKLKFIDRMVADSRSVALNHTAGLSLPQQVQMALFSLFALSDKQDRYKKLTKKIVERRMKALWDGMHLPLPPDPDRADYYATLDIMVWAEKAYGPEFVEFLKKNYHPFDVLFALAENFSTVLLNGSGFAGPDWSVRVSLANLPDEAYSKIGEQLSFAVQKAVSVWKEQKAA